MPNRVLKLTPDRDGYLLDGERQEGFPDRTDLPERQRVQIARWASQLRPQELTDAQRTLLERQPRPPSPSRRAMDRRAALLASPLLRTLWGTLDEQQQALVLGPEGRLGKDARYPLSTGELARLVDIDKQTLRRWSDNHLLPSTRDENGHRRYGAAAVVIAFTLRGSKQNDREYYRDIVRSEQPLVAVRRTVGLATYSAFAGNAGAAAEDVEEQLHQTSQSLRMIADALGEAAAQARQQRAPAGQKRRARRPGKPAVSLHDFGAHARLAELDDDALV